MFSNVCRSNFCHSSILVFLLFFFINSFSIFRLAMESILAKLANKIERKHKRANSSNTSTSLQPQAIITHSKVKTFDPPQSKASPLAKSKVGNVDKESWDTMTKKKQLKEKILTKSFMPTIHNQRPPTKESTAKWLKLTPPPLSQSFLEEIGWDWEDIKNMKAWVI